MHAWSIYVQVVGRQAHAKNAGAAAAGKKESAALFYVQWEKEGRKFSRLKKKVMKVQGRKSHIQRRQKHHHAQAATQNKLKKVLMLYAAYSSAAWHMPECQRETEPVLSVRSRQRRGEKEGCRNPPKKKFQTEQVYNTYPPTPPREANGTGRRPFYPCSTSQESQAFRPPSA